MRVNGCLRLYKGMAEKIFGKQIKRISSSGLWKSKWKAANLENAIDEIVHTHISHAHSDNDRGLQKMAAPKDLCKT